ncbi:MAG: hypothetical protein M1438_09890, partial [Deltaproteobacteria bacterium]|nr:hypothetical protein [Deltaproteobacteria bacterium]
FVAAVLLGAMSCALVIGFGVEAFKLLPFGIIAVAVLVNNGLVSLILGPLLLRLLAPRAGRWDLAWREQMDPEDCPPGLAPRLGLALVWLGAAGGYGVGLAVGFGLVIIPGLPSLAVILAPFVGVLLLGCFLL